MPASERRKKAAAYRLSLKKSSLQNPSSTSSSIAIHHPSSIIRHPPSTKSPVRHGQTRGNQKQQKRAKIAVKMHSLPHSTLKILEIQSPLRSGMYLSATNQSSDVPINVLEERPLALAASLIDDVVQMIPVKYYMAPDTDLQPTIYYKKPPTITGPSPASSSQPSVVSSMKKAQLKPQTQAGVLERQQDKLEIKKGEGGDGKGLVSSLLTAEQLRQRLRDQLALLRAKRHIPASGDGGGKASVNASVKPSVNASVSTSVDAALPTETLEEWQIKKAENKRRKKEAKERRKKEKEEEKKKKKKEHKKLYRKRSRDKGEGEGEREGEVEGSGKGGEKGEVDSDAIPSSSKRQRLVTSAEALDVQFNSLLTTATNPTDPKLPPSSATPLPGSKRKKKEAQLRRLEAFEAKISGEGDEDKKRHLIQKKAWSNIMSKASGGKVYDDPKRLKKSLKRLDKKKEKSREKWGERVEQLEVAKNEQQRRKKDARMKTRKRGEAGVEGRGGGATSTDGVGQAVSGKPSSIRPAGGEGKSAPSRSRPGFEGRHRSFVNK